MTDEQTDELAGLLRSSREKLCRAQRLVPEWWSSDLQTALDVIDQAGSACCPDAWSVHNQPEHPKEKW